MNARTIAAILLAVLVLGLPALSGQAEDKMFREIKLLIFDEKWSAALARLDEFLVQFPDGENAGPALFYKGKCLKEQDGRERAALEAFRAYLRRGDRNRSLAEDAETSIVDLALKLADGGDRSYLPDVLDFVDGPNKNVRNYAAIRLSILKEKKVVDRIVPVLKGIIAEETDPELRDRAKIALLRVAPEELEEDEEGPAPRRFRTLHFQVVDHRTGKNLLSLNIPWVLADLVFSAVPENEREMMRTKGYDFDKIMKELRSGKGTILEINDPKEGKTIKIWLD
jgi:hypothetical protein